MDNRLSGTSDSNFGNSDQQQQEFKPTAKKYSQQELKQQALDMHKLLMQFKEEFESNNENTYYILSKIWFDNWKQSVSYDENMQGKPITQQTSAISLQNYNKDLVIDDPTNLCFIYYPYRKHPWNQWLKPNLQEGVDYIVIDKDIHNFVNQYYSGSQIVRNSIGQGKNKKVVVNLLKFYAILIKQDNVNQIAKDELIEKEQLQVDENATISDYYQVILKTVPTFRGQYNNQNVRLWRYTNQVDPHKALFAEVKEQVEDLDFNDKLVFNFSGDPIEISQTITFKQLNITDKDIIIIEFQLLQKPWCIKHPSFLLEDRCVGCGSIAVLNVVCVCKRVSYCNQKCRANDERFHLPKCYPNGPDQCVKQMKITNNSVRGVARIATSVNGAVINSVLYCLSNTYALSEYFIQNKYFDEINLDNPLGTKGKLVTQYGSLIKQLWLGDKNVVIPTNFKEAVVKFQPNSKEFQQYDSLDFLTFLLDGLHEDLNRVKKKPYFEVNDFEGKTDFELAKKSWEYHIVRNQSIIVDLMHGQYKLTLKCPNCYNNQITFDPFIKVRLNIPNKSIKHINIKVIKSVVSIASKYVQFDGSKQQMHLGQFAKDFIFPEFQIKEKMKLVYFSHFGQDAQDPFELTQEVSLVRKQSKKSGLTAKILEPFEAKIDRSNRIFLSFVQKAFGGQGQQYQIIIQPASFVIIEKDYTFQQIHIAIFRILLPIFCDLIQPNIINVENLDEVRQYYEDKIYDKYYQVLFKSNSMYWKNCSYCGKKNCSNCPTPYSNNTYEAIKKQTQQNDEKLRLEFIIFWKQSPFQNILPSEIYQYHQKQYQINQQSQEQQNYQTVKKQRVTLQECLIYSQQPEVITEDNQWFCKLCKNHVQGFKSLQIYNASDILIFQLERFKKANGMLNQKVKKYIEYPVNGLDLSNFIWNKNKPREYLEVSSANQINNIAPLIYDLYAVQNHIGNRDDGDYTAFAKNQLNGKWYHFDDDKVQEIKEASVVSKSAYLLFYKRRA